MVERGIPLGRVREPALDLPGGTVGPPKSEQPVQLLALLDGLLFRLPEIKLALLEERLLLDDVELADVADGALPDSQFGRGALGLEHKLADLDRRLRRLQRHHDLPDLRRQLQDGAPDAGLRGIQLGGRYALARSEEHTSELQSLRHLVCRL